MGQILGIFAKNKGELVTEIPLKAGEESYYSLANIFMNSESYIQRILVNASIEQGRKDWLKLTTEEELSLKYNNIQDFADGEIEYRQSINEPLVKDFYAIGMVYDSKIGDIVYSPKYESYENWSNTNIILNALYKIKEVLFEDLRMTIELRKDSDYIRYSFDNIHILLGIISTLKRIKNIDEVALVYGPY
jgi:hypothetical protein